MYDLVHLEGAGAREELEELYTPPRIVFNIRDGTEVGERFKYYDLVHLEGARATEDLEEIYTTPHI